MTFAVEIHGASENHWNLFGDCRDLTQWTAGTSNTTVTYDQKGVGGLPNTASLVTDAAASPSQFAFVRSPAICVQSERPYATRVWILKDATASPDPGIRIYNHTTGAVLVGYGIDTVTGTMTVDPATTSTAYGGFATERTLGGQSWWEVWVWSVDYNLDVDAVRVHIFPALFSGVTAVRSITVGGVELYGNGDAANSPVSGAWDVLNGTPPNNGSVHLASQPHATGRPGNWIYTFFPEDYPLLFYKSRPTDTIFDDRLVKDMRYSVSVRAPFWGGSSSTSIGSIEIANDDGALDVWPEYDWRDRAVRISEFDASAGEFAFEASRTVLRAIVERLEVVNESTMRLVLRDPVPDLYEPFASTYASGATTDADYRVQPITFGNPKQVEPVLVDQAAFTYEMHDGALNAVDEVYVDGVAQSANSPSFLASGAGFILPSEASGRVTADPESTATADLDALCTSITSRKTVTFDDVMRTQFNALNHSSPETTYKYGYYVNDANITAADILNWTCASFGGWWYVNRAGEVVFGRLTDPGTLLENLVISSPNDTRDLSGWSLSNGATSAPTWPGLDGFSPFFEIADLYEVAASTLRDPAQSPSLISIVESRPISVEATSGSVTMRLWVRKDSTASPDPAFRLRGPGGTDAINFTMDTATGAVSVFTGSAQATQRSVGGNDWWEVIAEGTKSSEEYFTIQIRPAGNTATDTRISVKIGGVELYDLASTDDVLGTPPNLTTSRIITDAQILGDIRVTPDQAPQLSDGMGANKNWSRSRSGESGAAQTYDREFQDEYRTTTSMLSAYSHALDADLPMSLLTDSGAAAAEADRVALLYQTQRNFYKLKIAFNAGRFDDYIDSIGQVFRIDSDRLPTAKDLMLVSVSGGWLSNELELTLWG